MLTASRAASDGAQPSRMDPAKLVDPDYAAAVNAIKAEKFPAAIPLLDGVVKRDANNADAYNPSRA